jgi:hypothetical protein
VDTEKQAPPPDDGRDSNFRLEISIAVGYQRRRTTMGGKLEGGLVTAALLLASIVVVLLVIWQFFKLF